MSERNHRRFVLRFDDGVYTPPEIVATADEPAEALSAFIAQELEQWGFEVFASPLKDRIGVKTNSGVTLYVKAWQLGAAPSSKAKP